MNSITYKVHAVAQESRRHIAGEIARVYSDKGMYIASYGDALDDDEEVLYLYLTSNDKPKAGECFIKNGTAVLNKSTIDFKADVIRFTNDPRCLISPDVQGIPESLIKAYAESNGSIKEVRVEAGECCSNCGTTNFILCIGDCIGQPIIQRPRIVGNECVIMSYSFGDKLEIDIATIKESSTVQKVVMSAEQWTEKYYPDVRRFAWNMKRMNDYAEYRLANHKTTGWDAITFGKWMAKKNIIFNMNDNTQCAYNGGVYTIEQLYNFYNE